MANANLAILTTSNTFLDWMITTNNEANTINELRNGNFYKDGGNFTVAGGTIIGLPTTGTGLQIAANTILGALTTMNTSLTTAQASFSDNVFITSANSRLNVANGIVTTQMNVIATINIGGNVRFNATGNVVNIANNILMTNTGNANFANPASSVNVAGTLNANVAVFQTLEADFLKLDPTGTYFNSNGNVTINNLTVSGNQIITGSQVISTDRFQIRANSASDGDGYFEVYRGPSINANGTLKFNHTANVFQVAANDAQTYLTILTTANGVGNTVRVSQNGASSLSEKQLNFVNTANVTIVVSDAGDGNANIAIFSSAGQPPGGANQQLQFNDNTVFQGTSNLIYNKANGVFVANNETISANLVFATGANAVAPTLVAAREFCNNVGNINTPNTVTINVGLATSYDVTLANVSNSPINVTFESWAATGNLQQCTIILRQPGTNTAQTSSNTVNFTNSNVIWSNGEVPVLSVLKGKLDILTFVTVDGGAHVYGAHSMANVG